MADDPPARQMSLIPYSHQNGEVVLRSGNAVVVYDAHSRQLSVRDASEQSIELSECPTCHRSLRNGFERRDEDDRRTGRSPPRFRDDRPVIDPDYFGMLAASQRASPSSSAGPATPARTFVPPAIRSGRSRDVSSTQDPSSGAEFVGNAPTTSGARGISSSAFSPGYFKRFFREIRELGRGGNGVVLLVEHILDRVSLGQFACKRVPVGNNHDWLEKVLVEVKLLQGIPHHNLVTSRFVWLEDYQPSTFGPSIPCLWILQEFCNAGDLQKYVLGPMGREANTAEMLKEQIRRKSKGEMESPKDLRGPSMLTFDQIFSFFRDITSGLHHLHMKGYLHRDLKPSNCLLQQDGNRVRVLISDFGEVQAAGANRGSTGATGTISYCAPEVLRRDATDGTFGNFTTKSDVFSLGMIVYFMCFGRLPYSTADDINEDNEDVDELRAEIMRWQGFNDQTKVRPDLPEHLYRYLKRLLSVDPSERPSTDEILTSIKGGAGIADFVYPLSEDGSSRVSAVEPSPHYSSTQNRDRRPFLARPVLSSLPRHSSAENSGPRSPIRRQTRGESHKASHSNSRPTSPTESSMVKRSPCELDLPVGKDEDLGPPHQSPRLMLPPPPQSMLSRYGISDLANRPQIITIFRASLFMLKIISLFSPCSPYTANPLLLYPILALAAMDVGILGFELRRSILLLGVHFTLVVFASRYGRLCETKTMVWHDL